MTLLAQQWLLANLAASAVMVTELPRELWNSCRINRHLKHSLIKTYWCYDKHILTQALFLVTNVKVFLGPTSLLSKDLNALAYLSKLSTVKLLNKHNLYCQI